MRRFMLVAAIVAVSACEGSRANTMKQIAELQEISAQKDSLLKEVTATSTFLANLSREVSTVRNLKAGRPTAASKGSDLEDTLTPSQRRDQLLAQVQEVAQRVNVAENRLAASRRRVAELTGADAEKSKQLAAFDSTIKSFKELMDSQRTQIASLGEQVEALAQENTRLKADNVQLVSQTTKLTSDLDSLTSQENTVYYVVAPQQALMDQHVVEKVGGFLGFGKTTVPARDLDKNRFVPIDRLQTFEIPLPDSTREYRIITRQDVAALAVPPDKGGRFKGTLKIRDPLAFWANSKFLIVIEQ